MSFVVTAAICSTFSVGASPANQAVEAERALGKWVSTEQFEGEPRIAVSFRKGDRSIEGWAVLLGQQRKADDRATLGLSFTDATWTGQSVRFNTILPEDEGTIGWELRVVTADDGGPDSAYRERATDS